jgi:hypothetical protein
MQQAQTSDYRFDLTEELSNKGINRSEPPGRDRALDKDPTLGLPRAETETVAAQRPSTEPSTAWMPFHIFGFAPSRMSPE